ncbi:PAS domain S-box protein, partial [Methanospirillum sp.]|uniref:PAS domain S-box protein n=1 Tax=Methanospirillum sp. TaxID=45200 RepID=UPI002D1FB0D6
PPTEAERSMRLIHTTHEGVRWETVEIPLLHASGEIKTVLWNSATIYDQDGKTPLATIAQGRDITAERQLEREKDEAAAQIQENIAKLAILNDGIRNPLSIIATYIEMTSDKQVADIILGEIRRIDEMVTSLDQEWIKSEKILNFLKKHDFESTGFDIHTNQDPFADEFLKKQRESFSSSRYEVFIEELQAQLYTILDSIDALIYVADMENYEILYLNKQGRYLYGNILGQKCYMHLHNEVKGPCDFCTNHFLVDGTGPTGVYRWEYYNAQKGLWFDCRDRAIRWTDGRLVRLEVATDITEKKMREEELRQKTEELDRFWSCNLDLLCIADTDGFFRKLNPEWETALGYPLAELEGKRFLDFVHPDDLEDTLRAIATLDDQVPLVNFVNRYRHKDGSYRWIEWRSFPYGKYIYASARDISEYKRNEEAIKRSEERFRTLVNAIQETMSVIDRNGTFLYANAAAARNLSGKDPSYVIGKNIRDFVSAQKAAELIHNYQTTIDDGVPFSGEVLVEMQGKKMYFFNRLIPFRFSPDEEMVVLSLSLDVTEQHVIREEIAEREEQYRRIVETAEEGIWQMDSQENTVYVNTRMAEMLGYTPEEMLGRPVTAFMLPDDLKPHHDRIIHRMQGKNDRYEQQFVRKDGSRIWLQVSATALVAPDGTFNGSFAMLTDITERKKAEEALIESETRFYELFHNMPAAVAIYHAVDDGNDFIFHDFNRAGERFEQISRDEVIGRSVKQVFPGVVDFGLFEVFQRVYRTGVPESHPVSFYKDNRITGWRENYVYKLPSGDIVAIYEDVTEHKQAEHELSVLSESLSKAMKIAHLANWEYDPKSGYFTFNDLFYDMLGTNAAEAGGYRITTNEFIERYGTAPYADQVRKTIQAALSSKDPDFEMTIEGELIRPDTSTLWVMTWFTVDRDESGVITRLFGVNQDITERKRMEIALAKSEQEYRSLANSITDIFFAMDDNLRYTFWNHASETFTGISSDDALGKTIYELFGSRAEGPAVVYKEAIQTRTPRTFEHSYIHNGKEYFFEISVYPSESGISVFTKDITERKEMEKRLKDTTQKLLLLTQINRHDIFNELTAMHLLHDLALDTTDLDEIFSYIRSSKEGLRRIEQVLQFTREYDYFTSSSSMWLHLRRIIDSVRDEVAAGDILFENEVLETIEIYADAMIQKVFRALYENAIRHGQTLTLVRFYTIERDQDLIIVCEDDGVGIPDHEKDAIFSYGYGKHTGIGLFLAREILSVNGLSIQESGVETKGSRFEIHIPKGKWRYQYHHHSIHPSDQGQTE